MLSDEQRLHAFLSRSAPPPDPLEVAQKSITLAAELKLFQKQPRFGPTLTMYLWRNKA